MRPQSREIDKTVDLAKQVIVGDMPLKAEAVEQRLLHHSPLAYHRPNLLRPGEGNQRTAPRSRSFSTKSTLSGRSRSPLWDARVVASIDPVLANAPYNQRLTIQSLNQ
jgi:hypothetical protein